MRVSSGDGAAITHFIVLDKAGELGALDNPTPDQITWVSVVLLELTGA